jgi:hypothetical protein
LRDRYRRYAANATEEQSGWNEGDSTKSPKKGSDQLSAALIADLYATVHQRGEVQHHPNVTAIVNLEDATKPIPPEGKIETRIKIQHATRVGVTVFQGIGRAARVGVDVTAGYGKSVYGPLLDSKELQNSMT